MPAKHRIARNAPLLRGEGRAGPTHYRRRLLSAAPGRDKQQKGHDKTTAEVPAARTVDTIGHESSSRDIE
jgi:hypothetical protein